MAIDRIETSSDTEPVIYVKGVDLVNDTPIYNIKPYVPYCDSIEDAKGGFVTGSPKQLAGSWICDAPNKLRTPHRTDSSS